MNTLNDLFQQWCGDLSPSAVGDLLPASASDRGKQRVFRRLMTNPADPVNNLPGDYIFHPEYGAGIPRFIGTNATSDEVAAVCIGQMQMEDCVAKFPKPTVVVTQITGGLQLDINYTDAVTGDPVVLNFSVSA